MVKFIAEPVVATAQALRDSAHALLAGFAPPVYDVTTRLAAAVEAAVPHIPRDLTGAVDASGSVVTSIIPCWYLSPLQHVWEFVAENLILVPLLLRSSRAWTVTESATGPSPRLRALDTAIHASGWVTLVVLAVTLLYKHLTERLVYVLQPCHVMTGVLAWLCFAQPAAGAGACGRTPSAHLPSILFNVVCLHWVFGCWLAILAPDTSTLLLPLEPEFFHVQHWLLVGVPVLLVARRRYHLYSPRVLYSWAFMFLFHLDVLVPWSLVFNGNVGYVMVPPPGALAEFGFLFRIVLGLISIPLTAAARYLVVGATCRVCRWLRLPGWTPSIKEE